MSDRGIVVATGAIGWGTNMWSKTMLNRSLLVRHLELEEIL